MNFVRPLLEEGPEYCIASQSYRGENGKTCPNSQRFQTAENTFSKVCTRPSQQQSNQGANCVVEATIDENDLIDLTEKLPASLLKRWPRQRGKKHEGMCRGSAVLPCRARRCLRVWSCSTKPCCSECFASAESSPQGCQCKCDAGAAVPIGLIAQKVGTLIHKCSKVMVQAIIPGLGSNKTRERDKYPKTLESGLCIPVPH